MAFNMKSIVLMCMKSKLHADGLFNLTKVVCQTTRWMERMSSVATPSGRLYTSEAMRKHWAQPRGRSFISGESIVNSRNGALLRSEGIANRFKRSFRSSSATFAKDYYEVLGLSRDASEKDIKRTYLQKAKELHPDTNNDDPDAAAKFQEVQRAYEVLKDSEKRRMYDQVGPDRYESVENGSDPFGGAGGMGGFNQGPFGFGFRQQSSDFQNVEDLFSELFGDAGPFQRRPVGQTLAVEIQVSFEEAAFGCKKVINVDMPQAHQQQQTEKQKIEIRVPAGIDNNASLRLRGQGAPGPRGAPAGDLIVYIRVRPHRRFKRDGPNLYLNVDIGIVQAILGGVARIPTLDEGDLDLKIRPGTQADEVHKLRGKGIPSLGSSARGHMYVTFKVNIPEHITQRQRELLEEFQQIEINGDKHRVDNE